MLPIVDIAINVKKIYVINVKKINIISIELTILKKSALKIPLFKRLNL